MKYETAAAFRAALLTRLRQQAQTEGASVDRLRKRVVFERLLARLVRVTPERWALKGALALDFRQPVRARATMDADLMTEADIEQLTADLLAATRLDLDDHLIFRTRRIRDADSEQPEPTVRFHLTVEVAGQVFDEATLDVAVNTHADWKPERVRSHLLEFAGLPPVEIPVIPPEVHVAEKVHAYTRSYGATRQVSTRSKDLVDIIVIAETTPLDAAALNAAFQRVFERRNTHRLPTSFPAPPSGWAVSYRAAAALARIDTDLAAGYRRAAACIDPILSGATKSGRWDPQSRRWTT